MTQQIFKAETEHAGQRLDLFLLAKLHNTTRSHIKLRLTEGAVLVNGKTVKAGYTLRPGDTVFFAEEKNISLAAAPEKISLDIVYEDDDLAVIHKPQGMVVHPAAGNTSGTLANAAAYHMQLSGVNGEVRPGIVHRLDKDTSGLLVVAKNDEAHRKLAKQIENKICQRFYIALLEGFLKQDEGIVETNIGRSERNRKMMAVVPPGKGKKAVTHFKVLKRFDDYTLCEFKLQTGRTHQIRVHAQYIKHPVVGDTVYGYKSQKFKLNGQLLHAFKLGFYHPSSQQWMQFEVSAPDYFTEVMKKL